MYNVDNSTLLKLHWGRFFSEDFDVPLSVSFHQCSVLFTYSLSPEGQMAKPGNFPKRNVLPEIGTLERTARSKLLIMRRLRH
jgi:hypothetical protein